MDNTITIADLFVVRNALDLAASRGAFRGGEMSTVGAVFDKLQTFLSEVEAQAAEEANDSAETAEA